MYMCMCATVYVCMWVVYMWPCVIVCVYEWLDQFSGWYSLHVLILFPYQSLCHINTTGSLKQLTQWTIHSLHTHNIATHIFATSPSYWTSSLGRYWWRKLQRRFCCILCESVKTCINIPVIIIIIVTQLVITRHTLYLHSSKNQENFMCMISILVCPITTGCKSLCNWVGCGLAVLNVLYHIL